jgi:bla regulator protein blaR1
MTLLAWMVYSVVVAALLGAAAWALERVTLPVGRPVRWIWVLALAGAMGIPLLAFGGFGRSGADPRPEVGVPAEHPATLQIPWAPDGESAPRGVLSALGRVSQGLTTGIRRVAEAPPTSLLSDRLLRVLWAAGAGTLLLLAGSSSLLLGHRLRRWPSVRLMGRDRVRITPGLGPAVVGLVRPWIVLPRWTLAGDPRHLQFMLLHEDEHISARDTLVLAAGAAAVLLFFWNPIFWWLLGRLRSAVEMDCDGRVLALGVPPREYGALLLEVGSRGTPLPLHMAALAEPSNLLERRIRQMNPSSLRHPILALAGASVMAIGLVLVACETRVPAPTAATEEDVVTLPAEEAAHEALAPVLEPKVQADESEPGRTVEEVVRVRLRDDQSLPTGEGPLIIVDGVILGSGTLEGFQLDAADIASIEVVKGAAAASLYGSRAANGVIFITTKEGAKNRPPPPFPPTGAPGRTP